ncbi:MAG: universal stress protein, partial [Alphaproteobacteria bacterium]
MTHRTLLVPIGRGAAGEAALGTAFALAGKWGGHVVALSVRPDPRDAVYLVGEAASPGAVEAILRSAEASAERRAAEARDQFEGARAAAHAGGGRVSAELHEVVGQDRDHVAAFGRVADLIVVPRPDDPIGSRAAGVLEAALFETGRPVLVAPARGVAAPTGRVALLWNDGVEAARAVVGAGPFLARADRVDILVAGAGEDLVASAERLATGLGRHGVKAGVVRVAFADRDEAAALAARIAELGANLVVMGAYG